MKTRKSISKLGVTITDFILGAKGVVNIETTTSEGESFQNRISAKTGIRERQRIGELIFSKIEKANFIIKIEMNVGDEISTIVIRGVKGVVKSENPQRSHSGIEK